MKFTFCVWLSPNYTLIIQYTWIPRVLLVVLFLPFTCYTETHLKGVFQGVFVKFLQKLAAGFEPRTSWTTVCHSTNWATQPHIKIGLNLRFWCIFSYTFTRSTSNTRHSTSNTCLDFQCLFFKIQSLLNSYNHRYFPFLRQNSG